jgi:hypothetical protein
MLTRRLSTLIVVAAFCVQAYAQIFGTVRGTVLDPQGNNIQAAVVTLKAHDSAFTKTTVTDETGSFTFTAVPANTYTVAVAHPGFQTESQIVTVAILSAPIMKFSLTVAGVETSVVVTAERTEAINLEASSPR